MKQKVQVFGQQKNLTGILHLASAENGKPDLPLILILNSGLVNKSGPFRVNTELSRKLQENGISSFRFDLSGMGDSQIVPNDSRHYIDRYLDDIEEAIGWLDQKYPGKPIVVHGLCTGADLAHKAICRFERISGAILLDAYGYPTLKFYWNRYSHFLLSPGGLRKLFTRLFEFLANGFKLRGAMPQNAAENYIWELPKKSSYLADLANLRARGCRQLYIFSSGVRDYYNYRNQMRDSISNADLLKNITVKMNSFADHTYIMLEERARLFDEILEWLVENDFTGANGIKQ